METTFQEEHDPEIRASQPSKHSNCFTGPLGQFTIVARGHREAAQYRLLDAYSAALAFVNAEYDVTGDIFAAIRFVLRKGNIGARAVLHSAMARLEHMKGHFLSSRRTAKANIGFHYNLSNEFYSLFLDSRMVYSAAFFENPSDTLEEAQIRKLDRICRDLVLREDDHLLDVGCGWGGLITYAAEHFGARALGCTLSEQQLAFASSQIQRSHLEDLVIVKLTDYRDLEGRFDKISSVGMFEHVGARRLPGYFRKVASLLRAGGLFLNRGVVRFRGTTDDAETLFLEKRVFPGGELVHNDDVIREGERAGFELVGFEDLRLHYAATCRRWVSALQKNAEKARALVGESAYRTWLLYLAASAVNFEDAHIGAAQVLFSKRA